MDGCGLQPPCPCQHQSMPPFLIHSQTSYPLPSTATLSSYTGMLLLPWCYPGLQDLTSFFHWNASERQSVMNLTINVYF
jgi:hypothetical protein